MHSSAERTLSDSSKDSRLFVLKNRYFQLQHRKSQIRLGKMHLFLSVFAVLYFGLTKTSHKEKICKMRNGKLAP